MQNHRPANVIVTVLVYLVYIGLLILFGFQTWQFINFLFPDDQLTMKVLTIISFDIMALLWGVADLYYAFASKGAKTAVRAAWVITFILSLVASILYLAIQSLFRFHVDVSQTMINWGYIVSLFALTFNIIILMLFIYLEYSARHPHQDEFAGPWFAPSVNVGMNLEQTGTTISPAAPPAPPVLPPAPPAPTIDTTHFDALVEAWQASGYTSMDFPTWLRSVTGSIEAIKTNGSGARQKNAKRPGVN